MNLRILKVEYYLALRKARGELNFDREKAAKRFAIIKKAAGIYPDVNLSNEQADAIREIITHIAIRRIEPTAVAVKPIGDYLTAIQLHLIVGMLTVEPVRERAAAE